MSAVESGSKEKAKTTRSGIASAVRVSIDRLGFEWILLLVSVALWVRMEWEAAQVPPIPGFDPYLWPRILLAFLGSSALLLWLQRLRRPAPDSASAPLRGPPGGLPVTGVEAGKSRRIGAPPEAIFLGLLLLYVQWMPTLGFSLSTLSFLVVMLRVVGRRGWWGTLAAGFGFTLLLTVLFTSVFYLPLPSGVGVFRVIGEAIQGALLW